MFFVLRKNIYIRVRTHSNLNFDVYPGITKSFITGYTSNEIHFIETI